PIEIKSGQTLNREFFAGLERWSVLAGDRATAPALVYGGTETHVRKGINVFGWNAAGKVLPFESVKAVSG
ncbi:MAG: AAA family ATPase, partial [Nitrospira sp.]|nr:AAA family ATPase [Nitrospira sp.]